MSLLTARTAVILSEATDLSGRTEILRFAQDDKAGTPNG
jgi:hypothetical protein